MFCTKLINTVFIEILKNYTLWRCRVKNCHAFIRTAREQVVHESGSHVHEPLFDSETKKLRVQSLLRKEAANHPDEKPARMVSNALRSLKSQAGRTYDRDVDGYRRLVRCVRRKMYRKVPKTKEDTFVDLKQLAEKNDEHVRNVDNGIVFIARQEDLKLLSNTNVTLFADGTFQYSPKHFKQMLTIFVFSSGFYIPFCHFLLQNKLFSTYKKSLDMLYEECKKLGIELNVTHVMLDFEAGLIKAFRKAMPDAVIQGCRFHLGQSWWRNMEKFGLASPITKKPTQGKAVGYGVVLA